MSSCPYCNSPFNQSDLNLYNSLPEGDYFINTSCCKKEMNVNTFCDPIRFIGMTMKEFDAELKEIYEEEKREELIKEFSKPSYEHVLEKNAFKTADIPYHVLLETQEWWDFRNRILKNDGYRCSNCGKGPTESKQKNDFDISIDNWTGHYWIDEEYNQDYYIDKKIHIWWPGGPTEPNIIIVADKPYHLHAHHKHYIVGRLPWEYEEKDLTTLCNWCHWEFHQNNKVNVYSESKGVLNSVSYTICGRCKGAGWFPEYKHVGNGICFECGGHPYRTMK